MWGQELDNTVEACRNRNFEDLGATESGKYPPIVPTGAYGKGMTYDRMVLAAKGYIPGVYPWSDDLFSDQLEFIYIENLSYHHISKVKDETIGIIGNSDDFCRSVVVYATYLKEILDFRGRNPNFYRDQIKTQTKP